MTDKIKEFHNEVETNIRNLGKNKQLQQESIDWTNKTAEYNYSYNFSMLGRPIIQYPQDMIAFQEIIWKTKPDLIIETGIAHGGSLILSASMLTLLDYCEAQQKNEILDPSNPKRKVLGIDIDIRSHNRSALEQHPMFSRIELIEGSSIDQHVIDEVKSFAKEYKSILVCLDSNHTHDHVLEELRAYAPLVTRNSYCIVFDTIIEDMSDEQLLNRSWGPGNSPKTAVFEFLDNNKDFEIDKSIQNKILITVAPDGFLKRIN